MSAVRAPAAPKRAGRFFDRTLGTEVVKILPGEFHVTGEDIGIITVLGSCVAACIWDERAHVGGMNHFMLPDGGGGDGTDSSARYGLFAMEVLINELLKGGAKRERLKAKVFGGGRVLKGMTSLNVGERNARFVVQYLKMEGIPIVSQDLEDDYARKVAFMPRTGVAKMKKIESDASEVLESEKAYNRTLEKKPVSGDIELF